METMIACNLMKLLRLRASDKKLNHLLQRKGHYLLSKIQDEIFQVISNQILRDIHLDLLLGMRDTADEDSPKMLHFSDR